MTTEAEQQRAEFEELEQMISEGDQEAGAGQDVRAEPETKEILKPVLEMGFAILAPNWQVQPVEVEQLSECYAALIDKYFPDGMGDYGVEINAIMITGAVLLPRLKMPRKAEPQRVENSQEGGDDAKKAE